MHDAWALKNGRPIWPKVADRARLAWRKRTEITRGCTATSAYLICGNGHDLAPAVNTKRFLGTSSDPSLLVPCAILDTHGIGRPIAGNGPTAIRWIRLQIASRIYVDDSTPRI